MAKETTKGTFLNFRISDEERDAIDAAAEISGLDRSKQARALINFALGLKQAPYIPAEHEGQLSFKAPIHGVPGRRRTRRKRGRVAA